MIVEESVYEVQNIRELLDFCAEKYRAKPAVKFLKDDCVKEKSYMELKKDSDSLSAFFKDCGCVENKIAILSCNSYLWIVSFMGTVISGNIASPVDPQLSQTTIVDIMKKLDITTVIFEERYRTIVDIIKTKNLSIKYYISMDGKVNSDNNFSLNSLLLKYQNSKYKSIKLDSEKCCSIYCTSGTTGKSKGVMLSHKNLLAIPVLKDVSAKDNQNQSILSVLPSHHIYCITADILHSLYTGVTICINDQVYNLMRNIKLYQPSMITLVPMLLEFISNRLNILAQKNPHLTKREIAIELLGNNLNVLTTGGAAINNQLVKNLLEYGINIICGYGLTECPCVSRFFENNFNSKHLLSAGKINSNCKVKIIDNEIYVCSDGVMLGYYKEPESTAKVLNNGWLSTGDLGLVDEENFLYITGRKKNLIILSNGENISPERIENQLLENSAVKEAVVYAQGDTLVAEIFPEYKEVTHKYIIMDIVKEINANNPSYEQINKVIVRQEEFNKTSSKKIIRSQEREVIIS